MGTIAGTIVGIHSPFLLSTSKVSIEATNSPSLLSGSGELGNPDPTLKTLQPCAQQ